MKKIWFRLFLQVSVVILAFAAALTLCNNVFMVRYYIYREKSMLKSSAGALKALDLTDRENALSVHENMEKNNGLSSDIYSQNGMPIYTTRGFTIRAPDGSGFAIQGAPRLQTDLLDEEQLADGSYFHTLRDRLTNATYIGFVTGNGDGLTFELRVQKDMIEKNAAMANQFILIITFAVLAASLVYCYIFAKKFARPITEMNRITRDMANLDFNKKLLPQTDDEIGQLMYSINHLSDKLDRTLAELSEKNERLQGEIERERALDEMRRGFVANVSHELKTPISVIKGYAEGLRLNINEDDETGRERYCDVILDESERMTRMVGDILELSKVESGQPSLNETEFDLAPLIGETVTRMAPLFEQKQAHAEFADTPVLVLADRARVGQVLVNYLENAASHVEPGGLIKVSADDLGDNIRLSVYNSGSRVSEEDMPYIWQSFYRADKSHNRAEKRYGLGLSIVRATAELGGQEYGVYNTDDGVVFYIDLEPSSDFAK
ncbi:MAG: HAMP domain-containing histidine kinase [Firmicutes bacterium]|nr:HAMP domain-containing histidine kinase [Bacillota bacterium]